MKHTIRANHLLIILIAAVMMLTFGTAAAFADAGNISEKESGYAGITMKKSGLNKATDPGKWTKQADGTWKNSNGDILKGVTGRGIDVSYAQGKIDWEKVKADGIDYAILRLAWGFHDYGEDSTFKYNASECERLGIPYGVYLFSYTESSEETVKEAQNAVNILKKYNCHPTYPVYYDLEDAYKTVNGKQIPTILEAFKYSPTLISAEAKRFCDMIADAGYTPGIYANLYWFNTYLTSADLDKYEKWVAQYNKECQYKKPYGMWQNTSEGSVAGISGNVDMNFDFVDRSPVEKIRVEGSTRYDTAIAIADKYKARIQEIEGKDKFDNIVVASGENYPDALTGCYLAGSEGAPVLMVAPSTENKIIEYIKDNLADNGKVYILGGTGAVSEDFELALMSLSNCTPERLSGNDRYATNLDILDNIDQTEQSETLLVCSGLNFADALSASAVQYPMMIVGQSLTSAQKTYLADVGYKHIYIIGGTGAVNASIEKELNGYIEEPVKRIYGATRYETSVAVAKEFFKSFNTATITSGLNFPDGIAGGPLAMAFGSPVLLVSDGNTSKAGDFLKNNMEKPARLFVLGGTGAVSDKIKDSII